MTRGAALALALAAAGCGTGVTVTVVTVDARDSVHGAAKLEVVLGNGTSTLTQDFDLHGHPFPTTFSVSTPGRTGALTLDARAFDDGGAEVGLGSASATIATNDESDVALRLDPADFQVNTQYAGAQRTVFFVSTGARQLAAAPDGTLTAAWSDDCGSLSRCDEWGRRFDGTGAPVATAIAAGTAQFNINRTAIFGTDPALAAGSDGTTIAVWTTQMAIVCSAIAPDGAAASPAEVTLSDGTMPDHPGVAALSNKRFAVVWQEQAAAGGAPIIRLRLVDQACNPLGAAVTASSSSSPAPDQPSIAASVDGATAAIVWRAGTSLRANFVDASGALTGGEAPLFGVATGDQLWGPELAPITGGWAIVYAAKTAADPYPTGAFVLHRIKPGGGQLGVETVLTTGLPDTASVAAVTRRADGALGVAWSNCGAAGDGNGCGILAQAVRPTGLPVGAPIGVDTTTTGDQTDPSIAPVPGGFAVEWTDASMTPPDQSMTGIRARLVYPVFDDARGVLGAACGGDAPCGTGLVCATGSDGAARCHAGCTPSGPAPQCPGGGVCTAGTAGAACIF